MVKNAAHRTQTTTRRLRAGLIFLAIALVLGSAGPAGAAPANQVVEGRRVHIRMTAALVGSPVCAGRRYPVPVVVVRTSSRLTTAGPDPEELYTLGRISYVLVEASVQDESIGTISPGRLPTGYDPENDMPQADFTFEARKAGTTRLFFEALVPKSITGSSDAYISRTIPVEVVNCDYKVTMTYNVQQAGPGYFSILSGKVVTLIKRDGDVYKGSGTLATLRLASLAGCDFSSSGYYNPTTFRGTLVDTPGGRKELQLTIQFESGTHTDFVVCYGGGGGGTEAVNPAGYLKTSATFKENGGTTSRLVNFAGWDGIQLIAVVPVDSSGR